MLEKSFNSNLLFAEGSQSLLERVMCAEYLLAKGYLMSDLEQLHPQMAKNLVAEVYRFATRRLSELRFIKRNRFRLSLSFN
jgi:hypothetical protein